MGGDLLMRSFKNILMVVSMLFIVTLSKPVMALNITSFSDIPVFSVLIGTNLYSLDYANNSKNEIEISNAIMTNSGEIYLKVDEASWIENTEGTIVNKDSVNVSKIKFNNGETVGNSSTDTNTLLEKAVYNFGNRVHIYSLGDSNARLEITEDTAVYNGETLNYNEAILNNLLINDLSPLSIIQAQTFVKGTEIFIISMDKPLEVDSSIHLNIKGMYFESDPLNKKTFDINEVFIDGTLK